MNSPIKDPLNNFKCISVLKDLIPRGNIINSYLFYDGNLEFNLCADERFVCAHTNRYLVYEFWKCAIENPRRLYELVTSDVLRFDDPNMFHMLQERWSEYPDPYVRASLFFLLNHCSDKGRVSTGKIDVKNFNALSLSCLKNFNLSNFYLSHTEDQETFDSISFQSKADYLLLPIGKFTYNLLEGGEKIAAEDTKINHKKIAAQLMAMSDQKWVVLYKSHPNVLRLYEGYTIISINKYGHQTHKSEDAEEF